MSPHKPIELSPTQLRTLSACLRTLRSLDGKKLKKHQIANLADKMSAILSKAQRRYNKRLSNTSTPCNSFTAIASN